MIHFCTAAAAAFPSVISCAPAPMARSTRLSRRPMLPSEVYSGIRDNRSATRARSPNSAGGALIACMLRRMQGAGRWLPLSPRSGVRGLYARSTRAFSRLLVISHCSLPISSSPRCSAARSRRLHGRLRAGVLDGTLRSAAMIDAAASSARVGGTRVTAERAAHRGNAKAELLARALHVHARAEAGRQPSRKLFRTRLHGGCSTQPRGFQAGRQREADAWEGDCSEKNNICYVYYNARGGNVRAATSCTTHLDLNPRGLRASQA